MIENVNAKVDFDFKNLVLELLEEVLPKALAIRL